MSINLNKKPNFSSSQICYGQHGQTSVILQQLRFYFLYKGDLNQEQEKALLTALSFNIKHFLTLNQGQKFLPYERNYYCYYKEKLLKKENIKTVLLDMLLAQTLLINEYEKFSLKGSCNLREELFQIILESKECEGIIKAQIKA